MTREGFKQIIKLRSIWKIDHRRGDYQLPGGGMLYEYVLDLIREQLDLDGLAITKNGDFGMFDRNNGIIMIPFGENEQTTWGEQYKRRCSLAHEIVYGKRLYGSVVV